MQLSESVVEAAALTWFDVLGYAVENALHLAPDEFKAERKSFADVVLTGRLGEAIARLNPAIPRDAQEEALRKVLRHDAPSLIANNRAFHQSVRDGVSVEYRRDDGSIAGDHVRLIDFDNPDANDWLAVNQFTVVEGQNNRRPEALSRPHPQLHCLRRRSRHRRSAQADGGLSSVSRHQSRGR